MIANIERSLHQTLRPLAIFIEFAPFFNADQTLYGNDFNKMAISKQCFRRFKGLVQMNKTFFLILGVSAIICVNAIALTFFRKQPHSNEHFRNKKAIASLIIFTVITIIVMLVIFFITKSVLRN